MEIDYEVQVPGLDHTRSYYAELEIVGSDPVYITGSLYEHKGGPLVARVPTLIDTNAQDPWEEPGLPDQVYPIFAGGVSFIGAFNENPEPAGYYTTFDDAFSTSDGPSAVNPSPAIGATGVSVNAELSWIEAEFATSRELWLGKPGALERVEPVPTGTTYTTGALEFGQTYQWRVDQVGSLGTVTGHTWSFTTEECLSVDDFESYTDDAAIMAAWIDNIATVDYISLATGDNQSMQFEYQNQFDPFITEATRTFTSTQDWTVNNVKALSLSFFGENNNVAQPMYVKLEDAAGHSWKVEHPLTHAVESEQWHEWTVALEQFSDNAVDLSHIKKITIGFGDGTNSGQVDLDKDIVFIDDISLYPARCFNVDMVDLSGDVNGDCRIDFKDIAIMAEGWLNIGLAAAP
jgi:hypothetical protein